MAWTDERIDLLRTLWTEGLSASQIADRLGGVTRNAVIGKAHRLGLSGRPSPVKAERPAAANGASRPSKPALAAAIQASAPAVEPEPLTRPTLLTITDRMCKWPNGHPGEPDFHFCGRRTNPGHSYCLEHTGRAYQAVPSRRDRDHAITG